VRSVQLLDQVRVASQHVLKHAAIHVATADVVAALLVAIVGGGSFDPMLIRGYATLAEISAATGVPPRSSPPRSVSRSRIWTRRSRTSRTCAGSPPATCGTGWSHGDSTEDDV
jgi:hypothetical protein